jgi:hypothetical protein
LRVGESVRCETISIFPLFSDTSTKLVYRLASDAIADGSVVVEEVSESGSVPDLLVENKGDVRVLFIEGEELVGAKQNRVLNTSVLVAAGGTIKIPVSCVEQGRWRYRSRGFGPSGSHSSSKLRAIIKESVSKSTKAKRGHRSDQCAVWEEVNYMHATHGVRSSTSAMADVYRAYENRVAEFQERLRYAAGAVGVAVAVSKQIVMLDVFDKPVTCERVWNRLLSGVVFDALEAGQIDEYATSDDVEQCLTRATNLAWEKTDAVGEGDEYRGELDTGEQASALVFAGAVVHGSVVAHAD